MTTLSGLAAQKRVMCLGIAMCLLVPGLLGMVVGSKTQENEVNGTWDLEIGPGVTFEISEYTPSPITGELGIYHMDGNIWVYGGGELIIRNATLDFIQDETHNYCLSIDSGSKLTMSNATIMVDPRQLAPHLPFSMYVNDSKIEMTDNSIIAFPGDLQIDTSETYINNSWITSLSPSDDPADYEAPGWLDGFQSSPLFDIEFQNTLSNYYNYLYGISPAMKDQQDDGPVLRFTDSDHVTIADSRIDRVYEQTEGATATSILSVCAPSVLAANNTMTNQLITNLTMVDNQWFNITRGLNRMSIDQFDVSQLNLRPTWDITSVVVTMLYSTAGYNAADQVGWQLQGGAESGLVTTLMPYQTTRYVNTTLPASVDTITEIQNLNVYVTNTESDGGTLNDNICIDQLVLSVTQTDPNPRTHIVADNSELTIINSYVGVDYLSPYYVTGMDNKLRLTGGSHAYLYNMTVSQDDDGTGVDDRLEFDNGPVNPFEVFDGSEVYYYRWMDVDVLDSNDNPVGGAAVTAKGDYLNAAALAYISTANNLAAGADADNLNADARILAYLDAKSDQAITGANYNITAPYGRTRLPLITDVINATNMPNSQFMGNYRFTASYPVGTPLMTVTHGFAPFPDITAAKNVESLVDLSGTPLLTIDSLTLPLPDLMPGAIDYIGSPTNPNVNSEIALITSVENNGGNTAIDFDVILEDIYPGRANVIIGRMHVDYLEAGNVIPWNVQWVGFPAGQHYIRMTVDVNNTVYEGVAGEANNYNDPAASIYVIPYMPDFSIDTTDITFTPPSGGTSFGNPIVINVTVENIGNSNATNVPVMFYRDNPDAWPANGILDSNASAKQIGTTSITIRHGIYGTTVTTGITYTPTSDGTFTYYVWVDPVNAIPELFSEGDNLAASLPYVVAPRPNLAVQSVNITTDDPTPLDDTPTTLRAVINNFGGAPATSAFNVNFYLDDMTTLIGSASVLSLGANSNTQVTVPWTPTTPGYHTIIVEVDTTGVIQESSEADNIASVQITVYSEMLDLIVNNANSPFHIGGAVGIRGFVLVEEGGDLIIDGSLALLQTTNNQFNIRVRQNGSLVLNTASLSSGSLQTTLYLEDNAWFNATGSSLETGVNVYATGSGVDVSLDTCSVVGNFDTAPGANVRMAAKNTTFTRALDDIYGSSIYHLTAVSTPSIRTFDAAEVYVYRWLTINVLDGQPLATAYPVPGVTVTLVCALNGTTFATGVTDPAGQVQIAALSDLITPGVYPTSFFTGNYIVRAHFPHGTHPDWQNTTVTLAAYPALTAAANYPSLTLRMLGVLPDLDPPIFISNPTPGRYEQITISTSVTNNGVTAAHNVLIRFMDETTGDIKDEVATMIAAGAHYNASVVWEFDLLGAHTISIEVDPYDNIKEFNEDDNYNSTVVNVRGLADLAFPYTYDIYYSPAPYVIGHGMTVYAVVHNLGDIAATSFTVEFYNGPVGNDTRIGEVDVDSLNPGAVVTASAAWTPSNATLYNITVIVDAANDVEETDETNNQITGTVNVYEYSDIYISDLVFDRVSPVENNTVVRVTARVHNLGEAPAYSVVVDFYLDEVSPANHIGQDTINNLPSNIAGDADVYWTATCEGRETVRDIIAVAATDIYEGVPGQSNAMTENFTVVDTRSDLDVGDADLEIITANVTTGKVFNANVTVRNIGLSEATNFTVDLFTSAGLDEASAQMTEFLANTTLTNWTHIAENLTAFFEGARIGTADVVLLGAGAATTLTIECEALATNGTHTLVAVVDAGWDAQTAYGWVDEFDETNNEASLDFEVILPNFRIDIETPVSGSQPEPGDNLYVSGLVTNLALNRPAANVAVTVRLMQGETLIASATFTTGSNGYFDGGLGIPEGTRGQMTLVLSATNAEDVSRPIQVVVPPQTTPLWLYIVIIVIIVVAVVGGFTAYTYFVGVGKLVECGSCGAFIPDGAVKCPKCGIEFESETAKCSVCSAWIPIDAKKCPECGAEFTTGDEEGEGYEAKMRTQYDEMLGKIKLEAKKSLGPKMTDAQFQTWWAAQPTHITFDEWLREEEEMRKMGSKPCQQCGTPNSVTGRVCHKCGTGLKTEAPKGKMPKDDPAAAKPTAVAAPATAPKETKKCPNCNMQVDVKEAICPVCGNDFNKPQAPAQASATPQPVQQQPQGQQQAGQPVKRVVRTPIPMQRVVVKKPEDEKKEGQQ